MKKPLSAARPARPSWVRVWAWPLGLGLVTASGLVAALVWGGRGHLWAWFALGLPVAVMARFAGFGARRSHG